MASVNCSKNHKRSLNFCVPEDQAALELASIVGFMRQDVDRHVFRRFERLNLYNLLYLQRKLADYDDQISIFEQDWNGPGIAKVLPELQPLLKSYNEAFLLQVEMAKTKAVPLHLVSWLKDYAKQHLRSLSHELDPGMGWSELLSVSSMEKGRIYKFIEKRNYISKLFKPRHTEPQNNSGVYTYSERGVSITERTIINVMFCLLIIAPIFILTFLESRWWKIFIVLACVLLASPVVSILANKAQNTGLGVMAGYTAILVVFLSNSDNGTRCGCPSPGRA